jgi:membrane associated rhomboid family serine protease
MDRVTDGLGLEGPQILPPGFDASARGPLDRGTAIAVLHRADDLLEADDAPHALALYSRTIGTSDRDVSAAGFYGIGNALFRMDRDDEALKAWEQATSIGETPVTYRAWRQVAAARVRSGDLNGALDAYRQCERRAPPEHKAEIASRLGWLSKETGNARAAGKYFARSRGDTLPAFLTYLIIAVTSVTSLAAMSGGHMTPFGYLPSPLETQLELNKIAVAHGEFYRLLSVTLVHDPQDIFHLLFNMYALWYAGVIVERMYGSWLMGTFYVLCGVAASVASYVYGGAAASVGASGAIFGMFGVVLVATRYHHAVLDRQSRAVASQVGMLIVLNLVLGFSGIFNVDNSAHIGGLLAGIWLALVIPPTKVQTLASGWQGVRGAARSRAQLLGFRALGVAALTAVIVAGIVVGTSQWQNSPFYRQYGGAIAPIADLAGGEPSAGFRLISR